MGDKTKQTASGKGFVLGAVIGGITGAAAALLFTPKSGKEMRVDLNQGASMLKNRAGDLKDIAYESSNTFKNKAFDKGSEFKETAMDSASQLSKNVTKQTRKLSRTVQNKFQDKQTIENKARKQIEKVASAIEKAKDELKK